MKQPLRITFRDTPSSSALEELIRERVEILDRLSDQITSAHVTVESPSRHHNKGQVWHITVSLHVPGDEIVIQRHPDGHREHQDAYATVRDAFDAAERALVDHDRKRRDHKGRERATIREE